MTIPRVILIKGAGDLASGTAHRLHMCGFGVIMLELPRPLVVRRTVAFASAVYEGAAAVEGVTASLCLRKTDARLLLEKGEIAVIVDPTAEMVRSFKPGVLIDAIMAKRNTGTHIGDAPLVIGLGPGFTAGGDVHAVVETRRGHNLGKVIYSGRADEDTGVPGEVGGAGRERLLRAPADGIFEPLKQIGESVTSGETVALVKCLPVVAGTAGLLRGLLYPGMAVKQGMKVGDIDPRGDSVDYRAISDKARSVGGGVLEAIMNRYFRLPLC